MNKRLIFWGCLALAAIGLVLTSSPGPSLALPPAATAGATSAADHPSANAPAHSAKQLRSSDGLVESLDLKPRTADSSQLVTLVREHWSLLRAKGLAASNPVHVLTAASSGPAGAGSVQYVFKWKSEEARRQGRADAELAALESRIRDAALVVTANGSMNEAYQGFDYRKFPDTGGIELLQGRCNSEVELAINGETRTLNVLNGFVLMHRAPGRDVDGDGSREMYVEILQHGGDLALASNGGAGAGELRILRVDQNEALPQYGLIRAQSAASDFPATAMWVVHWRIWTSMGAVITDPKTPLVFGPTTVQHYPPVGTEFFSATGPVNLIHEASGQVVGKLTPRELTAFDIVVTKDDEVDSLVLNQPPAELIKLFNARTAGGGGR